MKVTILTGKFGHGHYSAAVAIKEKLEKERENIEVEIIDIVTYLLPKLAKSVYKGFDSLVKHTPPLYNKMIYLNDRFPYIPLKREFSQKISQLAKDHKTDIFVSTFHLASQYVAQFKKRTKVKIPLFTVITDISAKSEWLAEGTDRYFVPNQEIKRKLVRKGINKKNIFMIGIPVRKAFSEKRKKRFFDKKQLLIMGGGLGLMPIKEKSLQRLNQQKKAKVTIICGKNEKLKRELQRKYKNITVLGFVSNVAEYMNQADLLITKAGGVCMFEAIHSQTPMYVLPPFLEQEIANAHYVEKKHIGQVCWKKDDFYKNLMALVDNEEKLKIMRDAMNTVTDNFEPFQFSLDRKFG